MLPIASNTAAGFTLGDLTTVLLIGSATLIFCALAVRLSARTGLPSLLIYLGVGLAMGENGLGIDFEDQQLTLVLGYAALVLILIEGGLTTQWSSIRRSIAPAGLLATVGVMVSIIVVAAAGRYLLDWSWTTALLVAAIVSSTDAAAVFSVLRSVPLPRRLTGMLEAESGFNDAPVVLLVAALAERAAAPESAQPPLAIAGLAILELAVGAFVGVVVGYVGGQLVRRGATASSGLFAIGIVAVAVLAYAAAASVHASGFLATYVAALVLGNIGLPHHVAVHGFAAALGWLAQIGLFVLLGLLASPAGFSDQIVPAIVVGLVLLLVARPLSVAASVSWFGFSLRQQAFLSWAGLRGAVPVVLATVPVIARAPNVEWIFDLVFVLVVIFTVVQAPTLPWVARRLGVVEQHRARELTLESTPIEELGASLLHVEVGAKSHLHGVAVFELRLPQGSDVTLILRGGESMVPTPRTRLLHGDQLLIVTTDAQREQTERRLRAISSAGRLAEWNGGTRRPLRKRPGRPASPQA
ncbi:potassium/proton antiporter [Nostocoides sp.]|uniref:potassium/proton antiporter n=1 Tax=Nostocoides sp. TaxID=1917966 RepID=UPI002C5DA166|nr:potassium/proton antiporter [Tetrasphaera sp.]